MRKNKNMDAEIDRMSYRQLRAYINDGAAKVDARTREGRRLKEKMRELAKEVHYAQHRHVEIPSSLPGAAKRIEPEVSPYPEGYDPRMYARDVGRTDATRFLIPNAPALADRASRTRTLASDVDAMDRFQLMRFLMNNRPQVRGYEANGTTQAMRERALQLAMELEKQDMRSQASIQEKSESEAPDFEAMSATELQQFILKNRPESDDKAIKKHFPASGKRSALISTATRLHAEHMSANPYKSLDGFFSPNENTLRGALLNYAKNTPGLFADDVVSRMESWSLPKLENRVLPLLRSSTVAQYAELKNKLGV